ncbi:putative selenium-dependent hydroxylase accessory protein YqeC [Peptostreptococcaceae bacterium AS15]|nr:putative selenium-dependent hydroxylase accessory protein YqeC [Peptostreptococcaceae bacterium AS15]
MKDVISVVGAGGKTTVLNLMAKNISKRSKVLLSTTTKMKLPSINEYDVLIINKDDFEKYKTYFLKYNIFMKDIEFLSSNLDFKKISIKDKIEESKEILDKKDIYKARILEKYVFLKNKTKIFKKIERKKYSFYQKKIKKFFSGLFYHKNFGIYYLLPEVSISEVNRKFMHVKDEEILIFSHFFDYIILESDGARKKRLKLPKDHEPVISKLTTMTIAVIDIKMAGQQISEENTYNLEDFKALLNKDVGDVLRLEDILSMISLKGGVFKDALGKKVLCINKVESKEDEENAEFIKSKVSNHISTLVLRKLT